MGIPDDYMAMSYRMEIVEDKDEGGFVNFYPDLPAKLLPGSQSYRKNRCFPADRSIRPHIAVKSHRDPAALSAVFARLHPV